MSSKTKIGGSVLSVMHNFLDNEKNIGQPGHAGDLLFITEGSWLKDSAVIDCISQRQGVWDVWLIFVYYRNPLQLIVRFITSCYSEQKALTSAFYIRKEAAKDRRGTLKVTIGDLDLCHN